MEEVGMPMAVGSAVVEIVVSRDGKWIVSGERSGMVTVWDVSTRKKVAELKGHSTRGPTFTVDASPDGSTILSGSAGGTARLWSLPNFGEEVFKLRHDNYMDAVKFSHDGELFATVAHGRDSPRIYDAKQGYLVTEFKIIASGHRQSIAWDHNSSYIFVASRDGHVYYLNAFAGTVVLKWRIHTDYLPQRIALASNGAYIAVSTSSFVTFWDLTTLERIGPDVEYTRNSLASMVISSDHVMVGACDSTCKLWKLHQILPSRYTENATLHKRTILSRSPKKDELAQLQARYEAQSRELQSSYAKITNLENTIQELRLELASRDNADSLIQAQKNQCETLYAQGRIDDAARSLLEILNTSNTSSAVKANKVIAGWLPVFTDKCIIRLEKEGDKAARVINEDAALAAYTAALSLGPSTPNGLLSKWAKIVLRHDSVDKAMVDAAAFGLPAFDVHRATCDVLEGDDLIAEAIECFRRLQVQQKLSGDVSRYDEEQAQWDLDFRRRCRDRLQKLGDAAMESHRYHEAAEHFSTILSLGAVNRIEILTKRSKARLSTGLWKEALRDADEVVELDPSSHQGHEQRHAALLAGKQHTEVIDAHQVTLARSEESPRARIHELRSQRVDVVGVIPAIQQAIDETTSNMPRVLINTATGRLYDKAQQAEAFKKLSIYDELQSSMTIPLSLDPPRILREVKRYYRYVMLSHRWEKHGEPTYQDVQNMSVYELEPSSPNMKLQTFCKLARGRGFHWVWSDTCCIDKKDIAVLHESLVAMFTWYRGSALTLVHLRGVRSRSQKQGDLRNSEWNERGWTYQEYVAAETIKFYTEDWMPYLELDMPNHKESPIIMAEMEQTSRIPACDLATLQPGLERARQKLFLASQRQTTQPEDAAYSLLGIFDAKIFIRYGEGKYTAVGRLLEHVLSGSGDVAILAWTGPAGHYNSCLPPDLRVYNQLVSEHIPRPIKTSDINEIVSTLRSSLSVRELSLAAQFYNVLNHLPLPSFNAGRLQLPVLASSFTRSVELEVENGLHVYRGIATGLGTVEIKTTDDLSEMKRLVLVHPWLCTLLDQDFSSNESTPHWLDTTTRALRLLARLRQPFGALLLTQVGRVQYRRVATDSLIMVQIREDVSLADLMEGIMTVDVQ